MLTVPVLVWRGGVLLRGLIVGSAAGLFFGAMASLDSGMLSAGAVVFVVLGVGSGVWMTRRVARYWPGAGELDADQRVAVVDAVRRGITVGDPALAPAVVDFSRGVHAAAEQSRHWRWIVPVVLLAAVAMAIWDGFAGSWGNLIASVIYLVLALLELFWWPGRRTALLANADRAALQGI